MALVYRLLNRETGKSYIGWCSGSLEQRFKKHVYRARNGVVSKLYDSMRKHGFETWDKIVLEECDSNEQAKEREKYWIAHFNSLETGYNMTEGGDGCVLQGSSNPFFGRSHSKASIQKMRETLGDKLSGTNNPQFGLRGELSPNWGRKHSESSKQIRREKLLGRKRSEEDKQKMRDGWARRREKLRNEDSNQS